MNTFSPILTPYESDPFSDLPFPIFRDAVNQASNNIMAPQGLVFLSALSAVAVAVQGLIDVRLPTGGEVPTSLMIMVVANSGERKSAVERTFFKSIREFQARQQEAHKIDYQSWSASKMVWEEKHRVLKKLLQQQLKRGQPVEEVEQSLHDHVISRPNPPGEVKILYEDATAPAIFKGLYKGFPSAGLVSSEGATVLGGQALNDLPKQNAIWSGDPITVDRVSAESFCLTGARLSVAVMVQESMLTKFLNERGDLARGSGLLARFLVCHPGSTQGTRIASNYNKSWDYCQEFNERIDVLLEENLRLFEKDGQLQRKVVNFSPLAASAWLLHFNTIERQILPGLRYGQAGDHASKLAENIARVAALLHFFEGFDGDISLDTVNAAFLICDALSVHFTKLFMSPPQEINDAELLYGWLLDLCNSGHHYVAKNTIRQRGPNVLRNKDRLDKAINVLISRWQIRIMRKGKTTYLDLYPMSSSI